MAGRYYAARPPRPDMERPTAVSERLSAESAVYRLTGSSKVTGQHSGHGAVLISPHKLLLHVRAGLSTGHIELSQPLETAVVSQLPGPGAKPVSDRPLTDGNGPGDSRTFAQPSSSARKHQGN